MVSLDIVILKCNSNLELNQAYITGSAFVILDGAGTILQTIYGDDTSNLTAIAIDEAFGKIATAVGSNVHVYKPYGQDEGALRVC